MTDIDQTYMAQALVLARRGIYTTHPNPNVGCVIVNQDEVVGRGWHQQVGGPHAEIFALREAGERAHGATAYVTLEPCSHHGRTPPCCNALIEAGIKKVVTAMQDANPQVAGTGHQRLRDSSIEVVTGILEAQAQALNPGFSRRMQGGLPWLRCKLAMSMDGRTAMASGESRWISSDASRQDVQRLRARSSAIVTGIGTILADDPSMNVRVEAAQLEGVTPLRQPLRVIMDRQLRFPAQARMLALDGETLIVTGVESSDQWRILQQAGAELITVPVQQSQLDLQAVMEQLAKRDVNEVLLECGPTLAASFLEKGLIDELIVYVAPHLMGDQARGLFHLPGLQKMQQRIELEWIDVRQMGPDLKITSRPVTRA